MTESEGGFCLDNVCGYGKIYNMVNNAKRMFSAKKICWVSWVTAAVLLVNLVPFSQASWFPVHIAGLIGASGQTSPLHIAKSPNDPRFYEQTSLNQVKIPPAWDTTTGSSNQIVGLIDTGVNISHEDLQGRLWTNNKEIPGNGIDDDGNGYIDDYQGYNFMNNTPEITDQNGHGTGVASIIAANTNNNLGMAGINWSCKLMVLKALNSAGGGEYTDVAKALRYAADNGAGVVNMSFGTYFDSTDLSAAVDYALSHNVVIVAAAGNNNQTQLLYPAGYSNVIAVGAVDSSNQRASFSNYGNGLDVMAPGINILMANYVGTNAYTYGSGTSFAAAHVTGVVSLMLARNPSLSPAQAENIIKASTIGLANTLEYGQGLVNAASALGSPQIADHIVGAVTASSNHAIANGQDKIRLSVKVTNNDFPLANHQIRAYVTGPVNWNGELVDKQDKYVGMTDVYGGVTFEVTSGVAGKKFFVFSDATAGVNLGEATLNFDPVTGSAKYSAALVTENTVGTLAPGERTTLSVSLQNTGNMPWMGQGSPTNGQMRLGTSRPNDRKSKFYFTDWTSSNRSATLEQAIVNPGEVGQFIFTIQAPTQPGTYKEYFNPVVEYTTWLPDMNLFWQITVANGGVDQVAADYNAEVIYKSANLILAPGQVGRLEITFNNTGRAKWLMPGVSSYGAVKLGTVNPYDRISPMQNGWLSGNRVMDIGFATDPGGHVTLSFAVQVPQVPGVYTEYFRLVAEYVTWFGPAVGWKITVQ